MRKMRFTNEQVIGFLKQAATSQTSWSITPVEGGNTSLSAIQNIWPRLALNFRSDE